MARTDLNNLVDLLLTLALSRSAPQVPKKNNDHSLLDKIDHLTSIERVELKVIAG
jgi:hypothetical protein